MKILPTAFLATLLLVQQASARIGETLEQCIQRYGPVVEKKKATLTDSDPEACIFSKGGVTIFTELRGGVVWRMVFRIQSMVADEAETLLRANMPESGGWSNSLEVNGLSYRLSSDRRRIAVITPPAIRGGVASLELATKDFAEAKRRALLARNAELAELAKRRTTTNENLKGF
jgi:hypothetical protein